MRGVIGVKETKCKIEYGLQIPEVSIEIEDDELATILRERHIEEFKAKVIGKRVIFVNEW